MAQITNEVLAEKMDGVIRRLGEMEKKIDAMPSAFVSHEVLDLKLGALQDRVTELEKRKTAVAWGIPIVCTVAGSVITYLIIANLSRG